MDHSERFEIEIPADLAQFVHAQVGKGLHKSEDAVICEAVRALKEESNAIEALREKVQRAVADTRPAITNMELKERLQAHAQTMRARGEHA